MSDKFRSGVAVEYLAEFLRNNGVSDVNLKILDRLLDSLLEVAADRVVSKLADRSSGVNHALTLAAQTRDACEYVRREGGR